MSKQPLHYQTALDVARQIHKGELTSVAVTEHLLKRIADLDSQLKAFVTVTPDLALAQARQADLDISNGDIRSPLHGVPIAIKDLIDTAGVVTTYGMDIYKDRVPDTDSPLITRLKGAGMVILGKLKLTEGAYARHHPNVEPPINPWNPDCWVGVSSSGSGVATAAGLCYAALGTDTGGSIRFPSACNGISGLKPTWGRVSRAGVLPLAETLDHIGPMSRSVADAAALLQIIAGRDEADPTSSHRPVPDYLDALSGNVRGLRIGWDEDYITQNVDPEVIGAVRQAMDVLEAAGCERVDIHIPYELMAAGWPVTCAVETAHAHQETWPSQKAAYGAIGQLIELGHSLTLFDYMEQDLARRAFKSDLDGIFQRVDLIICPSMPYATMPREGAPEVEEAEQDLGQTLKFTAPYDFSGSPTLSVPWSRGKAGIPLSIQLVGRDFEEALLVTAGATLEKIGNYTEVHPDL